MNLACYDYNLKIPYPIGNTKHSITKWKILINQKLLIYLYKYLNIGNYIIIIDICCMSIN